MAVRTAAKRPATLGRGVVRTAAERSAIRRASRTMAERRTARGRTAVRPAKGQAGRRQENRLLLQLAACSGAFVLLVAAKVLLPQRAAVLREKLDGAMRRNLDVQAVFSTVGRAFSGEETAQQVWQAVFQPMETADAPSETGDAPADTGDVPTDGEAPVPDETGQISAPAAVEPVTDTGAAESIPDSAASPVAVTQNSMAWRVLHQYRPEAGTAADSGEPSDGVEDAGETDTATDSQTEDGVTYTDENLPDRVSMEQAILNFDYCTPVFGTLTSGFGYRTHPIRGGEDFHHGVDLAAAAGTEIDCFADGTVMAVGESTSYGKYCIVSHPGGFTTLYAHCSRVTAVSGREVTMGEKIAEVGSTGAATGPHLHFELQKDSVYLNPIYYVDHN